MSDSIREVIIRYKLEIDQASIAATTAAVAQASKKAQDAAMGLAGYGRGSSGVNFIGGRSDQEAAAKRKNVLALDKDMDASAAKAAILRRKEDADSERSFREREKQQRAYNRSIYTLREEENRQSINSARIYEIATTRQLRANAQLLAGARGVGLGMLGLVRSAGLLAAAHSETAAKALELVLVFEGTVQAVSNVSRIVTSGTRAWLAYNAAIKTTAATQAAAAALGGAAGAAGGGGVGGAAVAGVAGAAGRVGMGMVPRMFGAAMTAAPWVGATIGVAAVGAAARDALSGNWGAEGSYTGALGGMAAGAYYYGGSVIRGAHDLGNWVSGGKLKSEDRGGSWSDYGGVYREGVLSDKLAGRNAFYAQRRQIAEATASSEGAERLRREAVQREQSDRLRGMAPDWAQYGTEGMGRAEGLFNRGRAASLAEARGAFLGRPVSMGSGQWRAEGAAERAGAMENFSIARARSRADLAGAVRNETSARSGLAASRLAFSQSSGSDTTGLRAKVIEDEERLRAAIEETTHSRERNLQAERSASSAKIEAQRGVVEGLRTEREMYKEIAAQMRAAGRSSLERFGSMTGEDQNRVLAAKRKLEQNPNAMQPEDFAALDIAPEGTATANKSSAAKIARAMAAGGGFLQSEANAKASEADARGRTITAKIAQENKILVNFEMDQSKFLSQVAEEVGKSFKEYNKIVNKQIEETVKKALDKVTAEIQSDAKKREASRGTMFAGGVVF